MNSGKSLINLLFCHKKVTGKTAASFLYSSTKTQLRFGITRMYGQVSFNFRSLYELQCASVTSDGGRMTRTAVQKLTREIRRPFFLNIPTIRASIKYESHWNTLTHKFAQRNIYSVYIMICTRCYAGLRALLNTLSYAPRYKYLNIQLRNKHNKIYYFYYCIRAICFDSYRIIFRPSKIQILTC